MLDKRNVSLNNVVWSDRPSFRPTILSLSQLWALLMLMNNFYLELNQIVSLQYQENEKYFIRYMAR
jgi:hypothetical protein